MRGREGEVSFYTSAPFILAYLDRRSFVPREMGTVVKSGWEEGGGVAGRKKRQKIPGSPLPSSSLPRSARVILGVDQDEDDGERRGEFCTHPSSN